MSSGLYQIAWHDQLAEIRLTCGKANAINAQSLAAISEAFDEAYRAQARGVVLTGYDRFFSAGLDLVTSTTSTDRRWTPSSESSIA